MRCETCGSFNAEHSMPLIGEVCFACYTILEKPFACEGLIHSGSILSIAKGMEKEFERRTKSLIAKAVVVVMSQVQSNPHN